MDEAGTAALTTIPVLIGVAATTVTSVVTLLTLMYNGRQTRLREERNRQWDLEDRKVRLVESQTRTHDLHVDIDATRRALGTAIAANTNLTASTAAAVQVVGEKTDVATKAARQAFDEANGVNQKLEALGLRMRGEGKQHGP